MVGWVSVPQDNVSSRLQSEMPVGWIRGGSRPEWLHRVNKAIKPASWLVCNRAITYIYAVLSRPVVSRLKRCQLITGGLRRVQPLVFLGQSPVDCMTERSASNLV